MPDRLRDFIYTVSNRDTDVGDADRIESRIFGTRGSIFYAALRLIARYR